MTPEEKAHEVLDKYYDKIEEWSVQLLRIRKDLINGTNPVLSGRKLEEIKKEQKDFLENQYQEVEQFRNERDDDDQMGLSLSRKVHFIGMEQVILYSNLMNTENFIRSVTGKESQFN